MQTPELAEFVPRLLPAGRSWIGWDCTPPADPGSDLTIRLRHRQDPTRVAVVRVHAGVEVFILDVAGAIVPDTARAGDDAVTVLHDHLELAARCLTGPTWVRQTLTRGGRVVHAEVDFDGTAGRSPLFTGFPTRVAAALRLTRTHEVTTLWPRLDAPHDPRPTRAPGLLPDPRSTT